MGKAGEKRKKRIRKRRARRILPVLLLVLSLILLLLIILTMVLRSREKEAAQTAPEGPVVSEAVLKDTETEEAPPVTEAAESLETETEQAESTTMIFTGDILLNNSTLSNYQSSGLSGILSDDLAGTFREADILMVNEEFPFSTRGEAVLDKQYTFRVDPGYVSAFQEMGVDIAGIANNHILDFGTDALLDTCVTLDSAGIRYAGAGADLDRAMELQVIEANGKRFGFLAASRVWPDASWSAGAGKPGVFGTYDPTRLLEAIHAAKEVYGCDFVTVFVHWGIERNTLPEDYQRSLGQQYAAAGADLVIGMHPHVLQGIEYSGGTPVFYSLGNFIFGGQTYQTAAVVVTVASEGEASFAVIPCIASGGHTRRAEGAEAQSVYANLSALSYGVQLDENGQLLNLQ